MKEARKVIYTCDYCGAQGTGGVSELPNGWWVLANSLSTSIKGNHESTYYNYDGCYVVEEEAIVVEVVDPIVYCHTCGDKLIAELRRNANGQG